MNNNQNSNSISPLPNQQLLPHYNQQALALQNPEYRNTIKELIDDELEKVVPKELSKWFGSIQYRPRRMKFATQNVDEKIYVIVRMHWIRNIGWIFNNILYAFFPFVVLFIFQILSIDIEFIDFRSTIIILLAYFSVIFTNIVKNFYDWYYDVYIVTNERILDYEFSPFTGYKVVEAPLDSIQDVEEKSLGFLADLFNYGSVKARTASNVGELSFDYIADPTRIRDVIMDLAKIIKLYKNAE